MQQQILAEKDLIGRIWLASKDLVALHRQGVLVEEVSVEVSTVLDHVPAESDLMN